ncbi:pullulanase-type alpha-1,6-glucosidase [Nocardioides coralli]|uniref:pullulanase-type alpha-1,6-glucosidase n=1 Tax=Nocardioides coralli TaxID=2872154 RepID=UPI001CA38CA6|nr:pullulanase-type alpha-1,6-glucosidase [Nocardioides coralli]QZY29111.1 pullulanase-type alpha-1,6-glucosidase [Nocardioides coralli]
MPRRPSLLSSLIATAVVLPVLAVTSPAAADHTTAPDRVTVMGTVMDELGCGADWDESCSATDMSLAEDGSWELVGELPAGEYRWKVRLDGSWDENYGAGGKADGPDAVFVLEESARLRFTYDHASHRIAVAPAELGGPVGPGDRALAQDSLRNDLTREQFYFVMADRFENGDPSNDDAGIEGGRLQSGYDPTATGFYHGGDLQGILDRLDYIEGLGTTAIWLTPSFKNKPVQGDPGSESAGYHGYWITDFTQIDPHLGSNEEMRALVDAAHDRGMKVFFDIITNHTADVITYDRGEYDANGNLPYVSTEAEPYRDADGNAFDDRDHADGDPPFPPVDLDSFPYRPQVPPGEEDAKVPAWLNDPTLYHNRGTSTFAGESNTYGDFPSGPYSSLDDLWTEHPQVVDGMTDIYRTWVREVGIDGFRIDTVKHVNTEFWQQFAPALTDYAAEQGNDDFFMFGEVYDANPEFVSQYTTEGRLQAAADFGFQASATGFAKGAATTGLRDFFASDDWFTDADSNAYQLPTFLGNHDMGRIGSFLRQNDGSWSEQEILDRDRLAHSLMYLTRGQPVVYYGDEQGFSAPPDVPGGIGDQRAREDMFPSQVDLYNGYDLIGSDDTTATSNFRTRRPLYRHLATLSQLRERHPALADGAQVHRYASERAGVYAFSRIDAGEQREYVVAVNNSTTAKSASFDTFSPRMRFHRVWPDDRRRGGSLRSDREGRVDVTVPPLGFRVWRANRAVRADHTAPAPSFTSPTAGGVVGGRAEVGVGVDSDSFVQTTLAWRPVGADEWQVLGTDDQAPYRVFHDVRDLADGTLVEYRAVTEDADGDLGAAQTYALVGEPADDGEPGGGGPVTQPGAVSVPGSFNSELGCTGGAGGDWDPACPAIDLALDANDQVWSATFDGEQTIPAGTYGYKAAIDDSWDENYGAGGVRDGSNIELAADGGPITFWYSHATNWVTNSIETPHLFTAPGSYQSEIGCSGDWQPDCLRSWLQDPDGDGVWSFRTEQVSPGSYEVKAAQDRSWDTNWGAGGEPGGANIPFTVADGEGVEFRFDEATKVLTVETYPAQGGGGGGGEPDLTGAAAHWLSRDTVAWDLPAARQGWTYRLHAAPRGGLETDAEAVTGGRSWPLRLDPDGLPASMREEFPHLAGFEALQLSHRAARRAERLLRGQLAVAAYDDLGRLRRATGVQVPGVLDDVYARATRADLGVTWRGDSPRFAVWAPTAKDVDLLVRPSGAGQRRVAMQRRRNGTWTLRGDAAWDRARYAYDVRVYAPGEGAVVDNVVTDPYSLALTADSRRSVVVDLDDRDLAPRGWESLTKPALAQPEDTSVYELHVRDFSATDETVPEPDRGTYRAFTRTGSDGMGHLRSLADAGLTTVHLLPTYDLATAPERRSDQARPACDLPSFGPAATEQQACIGEVREDDAFNWGYDPWHYTTPEGSYSSDPDGTARTREYRSMVQALNRSGLRVVADVVYNHTFASGQDPKSVLDRIVPGYYHRLDVTTGEVATSTCCPNTASEHAMMEKLMVDSVLTWARDYKLDGFRFDLMGHHSLATMQRIREELDRLTVRRDGVDGQSIYVYGEGWNFGEVADGARFVQATQPNLAGTGIGSFNDRMRDAVHGGSPFDTDPRIQGFGTGLVSDPNGSDANGDEVSQRERLLYYQDRIKVGLAGNLRDYAFVDRTGNQTTGGELDQTGYAADPAETVNYVDAHDNQTLFDLTALKMDPAATREERARMNTVSQATVALSQGVAFWHAGTDLLRSKSLDRDSYDSGDWFNRVDWSGEENTFGSGLPPAWRNEESWSFHRPLLERAGDVRPSAADMRAARDRAAELLRLRYASPLFRLGSAEEIQARLSFPDGGPGQPLGVIVMHVDDRAGADLDPEVEELVVVFNATPEATEVALEGDGWELHPVQAAGSDPVVKETAVAGGAATVPGRTVAVLAR